MKKEKIDLERCIFYLDIQKSKLHGLEIPEFEIHCLGCNGKAGRGCYVDIHYVTLYYESGGNYKG